MAKKLRREERSAVSKAEGTLEEMLEGILELMGWQADLVRAALRRVRQDAKAGKRRCKGSEGSFRPSKGSGRRRE